MAKKYKRRKPAKGPVPVVKNSGLKGARKMSRVRMALIVIGVVIVLSMILSLVIFPGSQSGSIF